MKLDFATIENDIRAGIRAANRELYLESNCDGENEASLREALFKWALLAYEEGEVLRSTFYTIIKNEFAGTDLNNAKVALCASYWLARIVFDSEKAIDELEKLTTDESVSYTQVLKGLKLALDILECAELYEMVESKMKAIYKEAFTRMPLIEGLKDFLLERPHSHNKKVEVFLGMISVPEIAQKVRETFRKISYDCDMKSAIGGMFVTTFGYAPPELFDFIASTGCLDIIGGVISSLYTYNRFTKPQDCKLLLKSYLEAGGSTKRLLVLLKKHLKDMFMYFKHYKRSKSIAEKSVLRRILLAMRGLLGSKVTLEVLRRALEADSAEDALKKLAMEYPGFLFSWEVDRLRKEGVYVDAEAII
ncbi:hypothetical protein [Desulfurobacterium sp.]|uniref:hypothetical protein n=1 Tax=Desulfurobacterium sp. TaxID=2004706 RepID=UPI00262BF102|nr:hypothetical protein [Desulfurobacterium sp.]